MKMDVSNKEREQILLERKLSDEHEQNEVRSALFNFRAKNGLTQKEFAKKAGISHATLNKFEQGIKVTKLTLAKINCFIHK